MRIERIRPENIRDIESARKIIKELLDCIFEMNREIERKFNNLTSRNVKSIDFNITMSKNIDSILSKYATKEYVSENYQAKSTS